MDMKSIQEQLDEALKECERLRIENERLRNHLGMEAEKGISPLLSRKSAQTSRK